MKAIKRMFLWFAIYALEIQIASATDVLDCVRCPLTQSKIILARTNARIELARLRAEFNATLPPGVRKTWRLA
jgi:hypothetical protein